MKIWRTDSWFGLCAVACVVLGLGGCAPLPLGNDAPDLPVISSTGVLIPSYGVPVDVTVVDPDGDRVAVQFRVFSGPTPSDSNWTVYVDSGTTNTFYLNLAAGSYTLQVRARDELDETSGYAEMPLVVTTK